MEAHCFSSALHFISLTLCFDVLLLSFDFTIWSISTLSFQIEWLFAWRDLDFSRVGFLISHGLDHCIFSFYLNFLYRFCFRNIIWNFTNWPKSQDFVYNVLIYWSWVCIVHFLVLSSSAETHLFHHPKSKNYCFPIKLIDSFLKLLLN